MGGGAVRSDSGRARAGEEGVEDRGGGRGGQGREDSAEENVVGGGKGHFVQDAAGGKVNKDGVSSVRRLRKEGEMYCSKASVASLVVLRSAKPR